MIGPAQTIDAKDIQRGDYMEAFGNVYRVLEANWHVGSKGALVSSIVLLPTFPIPKGITGVTAISLEVGHQVTVMRKDTNE